MNHDPLMDMNNFFVVGINYKKTDAVRRGQFAINPSQYQLLIDKNRENRSASFFVLSTCNRTEIFGFASCANDFAEMICSVTEGRLHDFNELCYHYQGREAIQHLFHVAAGLDSQILGDYEVTAQIKMAVKQSKAVGLINNFMERLINEVLACTKLVRTNTAFSSGTVSVSFAAIQCIRERSVSNSIKKIVLIGAGKIGANTARNILHYIPGVELTIVNRTREKAIELAALTAAIVLDYDQRNEAINAADVVIVATQSSDPILVLKDIHPQNSKKLLIDLSVPCNIDKAVSGLSNVELIGVDELSKVNDRTLANRTMEIPKVKNQVTQSMNLFFDWYLKRVDAKKLHRLKKHLQKINEEEIIDEQQVAFIQKTVNGMAKKLQHENKAGCYYLQALNEYISINTN